MDCFESNPARLAGVLYGKRLISTSTRKRVTEKGVLDAEEKAANLLDEVQRVIRARSCLEDRRMLFQELCNAVKDHPAIAGSQLKST